MARVPRSYPTESKRDKRCGNSYNRPIYVDGQIPGTKFGSQFSKKIDPVRFLGADTLKLFGTGEGLEVEEELKAGIAQRIDAARTKLELDREYFTRQQRDSIEWLLRHTQAELDSAQNYYDAWDARPGGAWPLRLGDDPWYLNPNCVNWDRDEVVPAYGEPGEFVYMPSTRCTDGFEIAQRRDARTEIRKHFIDALKHLRCAEFGLWRVFLYGQAMAEYEPPDPPLSREGTFVVTPKGLPTSISDRPRPVPPDPNDPVVGLPDPKGLIPPEFVPPPEDDPASPRSKRKVKWPRTGMPVDPDSAPSGARGGSESGDSASRVPLLVGAAAVGALLLLR